MWSFAGGSSVIPLDVSQILQDASRAQSLDPCCYRDPQFLSFEHETLFRAGWISAGRADQLPDQGDYFAFSVADTELVAVRDEEMVVRVFANTCRHRAMRLLEPGRGSCRRLTCPFHAWTYGLDGALIAAPRMQSAENFNRSEFGLIEVQSAVRAGFIFVNIDGSAAPVDTWLGDFETLHSPWQLDTLVTASTREFQVACNWKSFLEVFNEYYHLRKVHPGTFSGLYAEPDPLQATRGSFVSQFGEHRILGSVGVLEEAARTLPVLPGLSGRLANGTRYTWVYPALTFASSHDAVWTLEAIPNGASSTQVRLTLLFGQDSVARSDFDEVLARYEQRMAVGMDEDIAVLEAQQHGLNSVLARPGRFCSDLEPSVHAFHRWYANALIAAELASG